METTGYIIIEGDYKYEVFFDDFPEIGQDFDFGDEAENAAYLRLFEIDELTNYAVIKSKKCECCGSYAEEEEDYLFGIHAKNPQDALASYLQ